LLDSLLQEIIILTLIERLTTNGDGGY